MLDIDLDLDVGACRDAETLAVGANRGYNLDPDREARHGVAEFSLVDRLPSQLFVRAKHTIPAGGNRAKHCPGGDLVTDYTQSTA